MREWKKGSKGKVKDERPSGMLKEILNPQPRLLCTNGVFFSVEWDQVAGRSKPELQGDDNR